LGSKVQEPRFKVQWFRVQRLRFDVNLEVLIPEPFNRELLI
jgi:hypothetical protein